MQPVKNKLYRGKNIVVNLLSNTKKNQILGNCQNKNIECITHLCIHQLFEEQVKRSPDAIAVKFESTYLTYQQLNQRANQLAHHLRSLGVGSEVLVGICVERSLEMVVGLLGIIKAGGAYVPLDPAYPLERLEFILADTQTPVMLTKEALLNKLPPHESHVICLDSDWVAIAQNSQQNPVNQTTADNLIYVIYTSGSTGNPKGVMIPHHGIYNQLYWRQTTFGLTPTDKVLQTISLSFDPSVWQIFWPLCFGAQLIMARPGGHQDTAYLVKVITEQQITIIGLVPSIMRLLLEEKGIEGFSCLRYIMCGGEALPVELIERFFDRLNLDNVLHNCYGPTEASIDATFFPCQRGTNYIFAPIGRPITNAQIYILNENLQPVDVGEAGELYISGSGLARGYLNCPELTDEKFITNPVINSKFNRLYKTGDLARYLPDGNIEFIGRIDYQVKIRGFRIELGEIEATLAKHPSVKESVIVSREDVVGDKHLVAYVVRKQESIITTRELRSFLTNRLPDYMIPRTFVMLDILPLNPNGKVDRRALPIPEPVREDLETFVAPRDQLEYKLTQIWQELLNVQPIGIRDNFFALGGDSLLAVKLFSQIEHSFHRNLLLSSLLPSGTVEALANIIRQSEAVASQEDKSIPTCSSLVAIQPHGSQPPLFCIHPLGGEILCYRNLALYLGSDQPVYGLQPQGLDGKQPLYKRVEDMASHYIQEIQTIQPQGPYFLSGYSFGGLVALEMAQQLHRQGEQMGILVMIDTCRSEYKKRSPFRKRIPIHLKNVFRKGPEYFWQKAVGWKLQLQYYFQQRSKGVTPYVFNVVQNLSATDQHLAIIDANNQALKEYTIQVYPGRVTLLRTEDENRDNAVGIQYDPQFGWGDMITGGLDIHYVPGSHLSLLSEPHVQVVAEKLRNCLIKSQSLRNEGDLTKQQY